jgi:hypothetical protein
MPHALEVKCSHEHYHETCSQAGHVAHGFPVHAPLERGERDSVLQYFELCRKFWKMGGRQLEGWAAAVKAGEAPKFGPNLIY